VRSFVRNALWLCAIVGAILLLLHLLFFDTWLVPTGGEPMFAVSIEPTLKPLDRIVTRRGQSPTYGQLARCTHPTNSSQYIIGRVFGLAGDTVEIKEDMVTVSGNPIIARHGCGTQMITHPATGELLRLACAVEENPAWTYQVLRRMDTLGGEGNTLVSVPAGKLFLVSDNRPLHMDSRDFGVVEATACEHIVFRLWGDKYTDSARRNTILW
jgi:signal peptidase I